MSRTLKETNARKVRRRHRDEIDAFNGLHLRRDPNAHERLAAAEQAQVRAFHDRTHVDGHRFGNNRKFMAACKVYRRRVDRHQQTRSTRQEVESAE